MIKKNLRIVAYEDLRKHKAQFGFFKINIRTSSKRNSLTAKGVKPFPQNEKQLQSWFNSFPKVPLKKYDINLERDIMPYNVLVDISGTSIIVFDCDVKNGKKGYQAFINLFKNAGLNPKDYERCVIKTPSGGFHIYFLQRNENPITRNADLTFFDEQLNGLEIKVNNALMFSGAYIEVKSKIIKEFPEFPASGEPIKTSIKEIKYIGEYVIKKWEGLNELPKEIYNYLELLDKKNSKITLRRKYLYFNSKLGRKYSDKLYSKFLDGEIISEGSRYNALLSLAGYLVITCYSYMEAEKKFQELAENQTDPPYPIDEPSTWKVLINILQTFWKKHYGSLEAINPNIELKITSAEDIQEIMSALSSHGIHFIQDEITNVYFIESEEFQARYEVNGEVSPEVRALMDFAFSNYLKQNIGRKDLHYLLFLGKKFYTPFNRIADFWEKIQEIENTDPFYEFWNAFVSDTYGKALKEQIIQYIAKWFVLMYKRSLARSSNSAMLVLSGPQQIGKGLFIDTLFPPELRTSLRKLTEKTEKEFDLIQISKILIHFDDAIQSFDSKDWEFMKGTISKPTVTWTPKHSNKQIDKPQRASYIATTNNPYVLMDTENKRYFVVKVRRYNMQKYMLAPNHFLGIVKYLANHVYPEVTGWKEREQIFFEKLASQHIKNTEVADALFENFEFIVAKTKAEAIEKFYKKFPEAKDNPNPLSPKLAYITLTLINKFLKEQCKVFPEKGEVKNLLEKMGIPRAKIKLHQMIKRVYFIVPTATLSRSYLTNAGTYLL